MSHLSEAQAWEKVIWYLEHQYYTNNNRMIYFKNNQQYYGLGICAIIGWLKDIKMDVIDSMTDKIREYKKTLHGSKYMAYAWSRDEEGRQQRMKFCKDQIKLLKNSCVRHVTIPTAHALLTLQANSNTDTENCMITDSGNIPVEFAVISIVSISSSIQNLPKK